MSNNIKLSPKYGMNPCIPVCFYCGKEKNEIALLGKIGDGRKGEDIEAPKNAILDYEPCDECKSNMEKGVTIIGVETYPIHDGQPAIAKGLYPTGAWCVTTDDFITRMVNDENMKDDILKRRKCFMEDALVRQIMEGAKANNNG